jgi:predicted DCC family thiol-disulfide oxidoreductase YuxK
MQEHSSLQSTTNQHWRYTTGHYKQELSSQSVEDGLETHKPRLVYDGVCNLCIGAVRFLNAIDHKHTLQYAPYQQLDPQVTKNYALTEPDLQGRMHIIRPDGSLLKGSAAISEACKLLAPVRVICNFFNTPLAGRVYDFIARRRYTLFGCSDSCYVPGTKPAAN